MESALQQVYPICPSCKRQLVVVAPRGLTEVVQVTCECGWIGEAVFFVQQVPDASPTLSARELSDSLLFFRRRLTQKIIVAMIHAASTDGTGQLNSRDLDPAQHAEDLANALTDRLAARETGDPKGYQA